MNSGNDLPALLNLALSELTEEERALVEQAASNATVTGRKGRIGPGTALELCYMLGRYLNTHPGVKWKDRQKK